MLLINAETMKATKITLQGWQELNSMGYRQFDLDIHRDLVIHNSREWLSLKKCLDNIQKGDNKIDSKNQKV